MKLKARLRLNSFISLGAVVLILLSLIWSILEIVTAERNMDSVVEIRKLAFERILLRDEFILYQGKRAGAQWLAKTETMRGLLALADTRFVREADKALLQNARHDFEATSIGFSRIIAEHTRLNYVADSPPAFSAADLRQISQVFVKAYSLLDNIDLLYESSQEQATNARNRGAGIVIFCIFSGIIAIVVNSNVIDKKLARRLAALGEGVEIIGAGNLDHRIDAEGDDELAALALANNEMAAKLQRSYTSVVNLQSEVVERQRAEVALRASEVRYRRLFEATKEGILILDAETGMVVDVNPFLIEMLGFSHENFLGKKVWELGFFKDIIANQDNFEELQQKEYLRYEDLPLETAAGRRIDVEFISNVYLVDRTKVIQCNIRDISERKQLDEKLRSLIADLQRSNKELEQFAYVASHDLQEPLRMVASFTQLLADRYQGQLDDKAQMYIHYAVDGAVRMQLLINDLLAFSRIGTRGKPLETVAAQALLGEAVRNLKVPIDEAQASITNDELPEVHADASQLVQVFQNLVGNGVKFRGGEPPHIHISARDEGREWLFSVRDNGIGIEAQYADKVFIIFQRLHTREEYPGSGIGLAICKKIVERHGGRIWFESEPGKGTTFYFTIPK